MEDISLYMLDLVQNSIAAGATIIEISVIEDVQNDKLILSIKDNGRGMDPQMVKKITDPFYTTRTTRRVGLGLAFAEAAAQACDGGIYILFSARERAQRCGWSSNIITLTVRLWAG
jgi:Signal transduction histidine kinase